MIPATFHLEFITPLFSKGFYDEMPEVRPPSIRGQLHWWFRALGYSHADEKEVFGGVHGEAVASKVVVRVSQVEGKKELRDTLPHKRGGEASPKMCLLPGTQCSVHLLTRLGGLGLKHQQQLERTVQAWLLMGSLGLRTTRGAGCFNWRPEGEAGAFLLPKDFAEYEARCRELLAGAKFKMALLGKEYAHAEAARHDASDTIGGREDRRAKDGLAEVRDPLGSIRPRKTSPLRFRVVGIGGAYRILALWDTRIEVTYNADSDLHAAIGMLVDKKKEIGKQLAVSELAR
jgi:CRISPR/Cas system CMR-associated protein Cmr1 (group 7 of RAMP superfamily)